MPSYKKKQKKKKQEKTEAEKLTNKAKSARLQYPEDHRKKRRKCTSGFHH